MNAFARSLRNLPPEAQKAAAVARFGRPIEEMKEEAATKRAMITADATRAGKGLAQKLEDAENDRVRNEDNMVPSEKKLQPDVAAGELTERRSSVDQDPEAMISTDSGLNRNNPKNDELISQMSAGGSRKDGPADSKAGTKAALLANPKATSRPTVEQELEQASAAFAQKLLKKGVPAVVAAAKKMSLEQLALFSESLRKIVTAGKAWSGIRRKPEDPRVRQPLVLAGRAQAALKAIDAIVDAGGVNNGKNTNDGRSAERPGRKALDTSTVESTGETAPTGDRDAGGGEAGVAARNQGRRVQGDGQPERGVEGPKLSITTSTGVGYSQRTKRNADKGDVTIAFAADHTTAGEKLTQRVAGDKLVKWEKGTKLDDFAKAIADKLEEVDGLTINVAGNGIYTWAKDGETQASINKAMYRILKKVKELYGFQRAGVLGVPQYVLESGEYGWGGVAGLAGPTVDQMVDALSVPFSERETVATTALGALPAGAWMRRIAQ